MPSQQTITTTKTRTVVEVYDEALGDFVEQISSPALDAAQLARESEQDRDDAQALDEDERDVKRRERAEQAEAKQRQRLDDPKKARAVYRDIAGDDPKLTPTRFKVLCRALRKGDADLSDSFESPEAAAKALGMKLATYKTHRAALKTDGYMRTQEFCYPDGKQAKGSGIRFCLPGRVFASGRPWFGPRKWDNRRDGALPKRSRKNARFGAVLSTPWTV